MTTVKYLLPSNLYPGKCPTTTIDSRTSVNSFFTDVLKGKTFYRDGAELFFYNGTSFIPLSRKEVGSSLNPSSYSAITSTYGNIVEEGVPILQQLEGQDVTSGMFYVNFMKQMKDENAAKKCLEKTVGGKRRRRKSRRTRRQGSRRRGTRRRRS
jgi:hypothetical protein